MQKLCSAGGCSNHHYQHEKKLSFLAFPDREKEPERRQRWIWACRRQNPDGSRWKPAAKYITCAFQNNDYLYSGHTDGHVHIWSMKSKRIISSIDAHPGQSILWVAFTSNDCMLTQSRGGEVKIWKLSAENQWCEESMIKSGSLGFCRGRLVDQKTVAVPGEDQSEVKVHDLETGNVKVNLRADDKERKFGMCMSIKTADESSNSSRILIGYENGSVALWDTRTGKMADNFKVHEESLMCMAYSEGINKGFSGSANEVLKSWTITEDRLAESGQVKITNPGFNDVIVRKDNKIVVTAGWDSNIRVFGAKHLKPLAVLSHHKDSVNCLTFSEDNLLACGSKDNQISLWDIYR